MITSDLRDLLFYQFKARGGPDVASGTGLGVFSAGYRGPAVTAALNGTLWLCFPEFNKARQAAFDHAEIWAYLDLRSTTRALKSRPPLVTIRARTLRGYYGRTEVDAIQSNAPAPICRDLGWHRGTEPYHRRDLVSKRNDGLILGLRLAPGDGAILREVELKLEISPIDLATLKMSPAVPMQLSCREHGNRSILTRESRSCAELAQRSDHDDFFIDACSMQADDKRSEMRMMPPHGGIQLRREV